MENFDIKNLFDKDGSKDITKWKWGNEHSNDMFGYISAGDPEYDEEMKKSGFVYKCIADQTSNYKEWMGFSFAAGRNIIGKILKMEPFGHLASSIIDISYPEMGLSPNLQASFVHMCTMHPDWHMVKELRITTRSAWFISDCKSPFVRIIESDKQESGIKESVFYIPESRKLSTKDRIKVQRKDFLYKAERTYAMYLWGAKNRRSIMYIGEDDTFVYWVDYCDTKKICRTPHYEMWYTLNTLWIDDIPLEDIKNLYDEAKKSKNENIVDDFIKNYYSKSTAK